LANLGYPKFAHLKKRSQKINPAVVLISALKANDVDSRIVEALPWLIYQFPDMDWVIVVRSAKITDSQNRLGFLLSLAEIKAKKSNEKEKQDLFRELLSNLERSRLYGEDSFRRENLTASERAWLKKYRSKNAKHWRIWSNLTPDHLTF
jgi:hypothetical protein